MIIEKAKLIGLFLFISIAVTATLYIEKPSYGITVGKNLAFNNLPIPQIDIPFILPFNNGIAISNPITTILKQPGILNHPGLLDPKTQTESPAEQNEQNRFSAAASTCSNTNLDDTFNEVYTLKDGQISPNGKWKNVYNGFGSSGVEIADGSHVFFLKPKTATSSSSTQAALVRSTGTYCNFVVDFDTKTVKQLRLNSKPNTWEVGYFVFRYTDTYHYYAFLLKPNGIELEKKDCNTCTNSVQGQHFLVTKDFPKLQLNKWMHWKVSAIGNHIQIWVDGTKVIDYIDKTMSPKLSAGNIAMYAEDAYVRYDNMHLRPQ
jgi:hypothetical protein